MDGSFTRRAGLPFAAACLAAAATCAAGEAAAPAPGLRVRVTTAEGRYVGRLKQLGTDTLVLERQRGDRTDSVPIARTDIRKLEVSQRPSRRGKGATIGSLVGLGAAVAIGVWGGEDCAADPGPATWANLQQKLDSSFCVDHGAAGALSAVVTLPLGALAGYALAPGEKWRPAGPAELTIAPTVPRGGGAGLRLTLSF